MLYSKEKPETFQYLNNNYFYYNYNIQSASIQDLDENGNVTYVDGYSYNQVKIHGKPDYEKCAKAIIREYISENDEFSIINDFLAYQLGFFSDEAYEKKYKEFLSKINDLKAGARSDFGKE